MNAVLLLIATSLAGQVQPPAAGPPPSKPVPTRVTPAKPETEKVAEEEEEQQPIFTLDQIAAGAKNDAFVDEFLKDKTLKLYGRVLQIERVNSGEKAESGYRVVMGRLSREDRGVDVEVWFHFPLTARKELALLEPGESKITIEGVCAATQMQPLHNGHGFTLAIKDCKMTETPADIENPLPTITPRTSILPVITPEAPPSVNPAGNNTPPPPTRVPPEPRGSAAP